MLAVLCCLACVKCVFTVSQGYIRTRDEYLRENNVVPQIIPYVPRTDIEVRYGTERIYMGGVIAMVEVTQKLTVKFDGAPSGQSTVIQVFNSTCTRFRWVRANIPGGDLDKGEDVIYDTPGGPWNPIAVLLVLLVFPQQERLDASRLKDYLRQAQCGSVVHFAKEFLLHDAVGINGFSFASEICNSDADYPVPSDLPEVLRGVPGTVLEVEFVDGVTFRLGDCVLIFLTGRAPVRIKFSTRRGYYYTVLFVFKGFHGTNREECSWLRINIPDNDFCVGDEVIAYNPPVENLGGRRFFLLFSQGPQPRSVADASGVTTLAPRKMLDRLQLEEPVAWNHYRAQPFTGVPPEASRGCYHPGPTSFTATVMGSRRATQSRTVTTEASTTIEESTTPNGDSGVEDGLTVSLLQDCRYCLKPALPKPRTNQPMRSRQAFPYSLPLCSYDPIAEA